MLAAVAVVLLDLVSITHPSMLMIRGWGFGCRAVDGLIRAAQEWHGATRFSSGRDPSRPTAKPLGGGTGGGNPNKRSAPRVEGKEDFSLLLAFKVRSSSLRSVRYRGDGPDEF